MKNALNFNKLYKILLISIMSLYGIQQASFDTFAEENNDGISVENVENLTDSVIKNENEEVINGATVDFEQNTVDFESDASNEDNLSQIELEDNTHENEEDSEAEESENEEEIAEEKNDEASSTFEGATSLKFGLSSNYNILPGKMSYFTFTPSETKVYTIESLSSEDTKGYLYSNSQVQIAEDDDGGQGSNFCISALLRANTTYYLGVKAYSSSASFSYQVEINEAVMQGMHGNLSWNIQDGILKVSGFGTMADMKNYTSAPWYSFREIISSVVVDEGVTSISKYAFYGLTGVKNITIPSTLTLIGSNAFRSCSGLDSIYIPATVTTINASSYSLSPFYGCKSSLVIYTDAASKLSGWGRYWSYYKSNYSLTVTYAYSDAEIKYWNELDTSQETIVISDAITSIPGGAFENCTNIKSIIIPSSITSIGANAFKNCTSLKSIYIPSTVTKIIASINTQSPFTGCSNDFVIYTDASSKLEGWQTYWNLLDVKDEISVVYNYSSDEKSFWENLDASMSTVVLPNYVTSIPDAAFENNVALTSIVIPASVKTIGSFAFNGCTNLESISIGVNVTDIGSYAFANCTSLKEVNLSASISSIKDHTFESCTSLQNFIAPNNVTYIGWGAFRNCTNLTNVRLPKKTNVIEDSSFEGCFGLRNIYLYKNSKAIQYFKDSQYNVILVDANTGESALKLEGYSLSLNNAMGLKFYFTFGLEILEDENAYVVLDNGTTQQVFNISSSQPEYNGYYGFCANVSAKDLFEPITCKVVDGNNQTLTSVSYSANQYLQFILNHEDEYAAYKDIVNSIMNYGISTRNYFGNGEAMSLTSSLKNVDLSQYQAQLNDKIPYRGARLVLKTQLGMKFYFTNGNEFKVNGVVVTPKTEDGYKVVEIENIQVADIDAFYTITVDGQSMNYSLLSYGYAGLQTGNEDLIQLIQSLYTYFETLQSYKTQVQDTLGNAKKSLEIANVQYAQAEKLISAGVMSYFEYILNNQNSTEIQKQDALKAISVINRHSSDRLTYIENPTEAQKRNYSTVVGGKGDATSWEKFLMVTQESLNETNVLRNKENLPSLMTSCYMMASSQVQANASSYYIGHSKLENVAENLYWSYIKVDDYNSVQDLVNHLYKGWYTDEKLVYDYLQSHPNATTQEIVKGCNLPDESYVQTGHYTNIISDAKATGFGANGTGTSKGSGYGYVYSQTFSSNADYALYNVNDFMNGARSYYSKTVNSYIQAANECNRLTNVIEKLESSLQTSGIR